MLHRFYLGQRDALAEHDLLLAFKREGVSNITVTEGFGLIKAANGTQIEKCFVIDVISVTDDSGCDADFDAVYAAVRYYLTLQMQECGLVYSESDRIGRTILPYV